MTTIIILLILAGISIAQLTGNGLFEKAKLAKEESKNAQDYENTTLGEYENSISEYFIADRASAEEIKKIAQSLNNIGIETDENETIDSLCEKISNINNKKVTKYTLNRNSI